MFYSIINESVQVAMVALSLSLDENDYHVVAGVTGLEPATSCVTGRRSNQLSYTPTRFNGGR